MRIVFMGYQTWGHRVLEALLASGHEVPLVITHPASGHVYETIWNDSVVQLAERHGIPVLERKYANDDEVAEELERLRPDLLVSSDWRTWVAPRIYGLATYGAINVHDALLPRYGGFAPLNWALVNGESEVGVTVHFMNEDFDLGDIVVQQRVAVEEKDTVTDLFHKTVELFAPATLEAIDLIGSGRTEWTRQDPAQATFFHKRSIEDSRVDWTWSARDIGNLVRAQVDPYPNAFAYYKGERIRILAASVSKLRLGGTVGRVFRPEGEGVAVVCGPDARRGTEYGVVVERVRTDDGRELSGVEFFRTMGGYLTSRP
ncbi:methionyl-tRNA formyltransferase [Streptomyces sp. AP-93]|uniref:methionyl-tRNA formyltransferase n=1 Tax=Streptomyces sp. AP-93 TaxID=2929048 RepID=UPI001FAF204A|nr:methionyl-tRNA formyltransferase [Streptomyces sp. AP-93]MCJ0873477.1 methionyl-tRNA formyltransferase [Streptomyces sp. AP-93]